MAHPLFPLILAGGGLAAGTYLASDDKGDGIGMKDMLPLIGGSALVLAGSAMEKKPLKMAMMGGGGIVATYGLYKMWQASERGRKAEELDKASGNDPAVQQASALYNAIYAVGGFGISLIIDRPALLAIAAQITCWDAVKHYYKTLAGHNIESDLAKLSASDRLAFDQVLQRDGKHLHCLKDNTTGSPKTDNSFEPAVSFAAGTNISTAKSTYLRSSGREIYAWIPWNNIYGTAPADTFLGSATGRESIAEGILFTEVKHEGARRQDVKNILASAIAKAAGITESRYPDVTFWVATSDIRRHKNGDALLALDIYTEIRDTK